MRILLGLGVWLTAWGLLAKFITAAWRAADELDDLHDWETND